MGNYIVPPRKRPKDDAGYFEQLTKAVFQSGFNWRVIENKWPEFQRAFKKFSVKKVAAFTDRDIDRLLRDERIVRNARKIRSTIENAGEMLIIQREHGSFRKYLRSLRGLGYRQVSKELTHRFAHLGRTGAYVFLWCVGEEVPDWEDR